ncbi:MAG: IPExxxVDY family protein [Chitinophagaceae bacterium]|nr:IPExxxVDY family protein [Chitinophagaceae bacterium]MCA6486556.1 IPExxxVDY family protein [Chitinophagaceae bacterium]
MKLKLDTEGMQDDFFADGCLLGITAPLKCYQFCLALNKQLGYNFRLVAEYEIVLKKKDRSYYFSVYESSAAGNPLCHLLYHNHYDGEYLLPEFKHIDFLWLIRGDITVDNAVETIRQQVKTISEVQLVAELPFDQLKNWSNLIL